MTLTTTDNILADRHEVENWLPHRDLMLLVDRVQRCDNRRARGELDVQPDAFWASGHFPGAPIMPGVLQVEFAAQLAGIVLARSSDSLPADSLGVFAAIRKVSFRRPVMPPSVLVGLVVLEERAASAASFKFVLSVGRERVADGQLTPRVHRYLSPVFQPFLRRESPQ